MRSVFTPHAPKPAGHYQQGWVHNGLVYVSGQLPIDPASTPNAAAAIPPVASIEEQTEQALRNVAAVLTAAGTSLSHVIKTTVYVSDIALWGRVNAVYARVFGEHCPARSVVPTRELHFGFQIEIEAIAALPESP